MARFEKERDPEEIQEILSLSATVTRSTDDGLDSDLRCRDDYSRRDGRKRILDHDDEQLCQHARDRHSKRFAPCVTSPLQKSMLSEEKTMKNDPGYKVFVANLAFSTTEKMIENHMARVGSVLKVLLFKNPNGSSKGMGIVQYRSEESVERAINELSDSELDKRRVYIRKHMEEEEREKCGIVTINRPIDRPRPPANPSATVFINNLDYNCTWQQIKDVFKAAGKIVYCEVQLDKEGRSKGMGSVQYERPIEALNAIALFHGQVLFNRALMVRMDNRSSIKPDSMTVKHVFGGSLNMLNQSAALALLGGSMSGLGMNLFSLSGGLNNNIPEKNKTISSTNGQHSLLTGINVSTGGYYPNTEDSPFVPTSRAPPLLPSPFSFHQSMPSHDHKPREHHQSKIDVATSDNVLNDNDHTSNSPGRSAPPTNGSWQDPDFLYTKAPLAKERRVLIKNLNFKTPWQKLKDLFRRAGRVQFVDIMQGPDGRPNGNAFVLFDRPEEANKAIEMFHNSELDGRKIEVRLDRLSSQ